LRATGHFARDCDKRKGIDKALVALTTAVEEEEQHVDEWDLALETSEEKVFFSQTSYLITKLPSTYSETEIS
jgi:hypothetical protein